MEISFSLPNTVSEYIAYFFGITAFLVAQMAFIKKGSDHLHQRATIISGLWVLHWIFIGNIFIAIITSMDFTKRIIAWKTKHSPTRIRVIFATFFIILASTITAFSEWRIDVAMGWILSIIGTISYYWGAPFAIRIGNIIKTPFSIILVLYTGSIIFAIQYFSGLLSNLIGMYRTKKATN